MKILVVDDHPLYIDGLRYFLNKLIDELEIIEAPSVDQALEVFTKHKFELVLIDFKLSDMNGLDLLKALLVREATTPLAIISGEDQAGIAKRALDLGACGFIPKSLSQTQLEEAIQTIMGGGEFLTPKMRVRVDQLNRLELFEHRKNVEHGLHGITERQLDVLRVMAKGYTNKRISRILNISPETVKEHIRNIFVRLDVDNRMACAVRAKELGLDIAE